jgi:DmsE family decaheme c-type cytochrome
MTSVRNLLKFAFLLAPILAVGVVLALASAGLKADTAGPGPAPAAGTKAPPAATYVGTDTCVGCHQDVKDGLQKTLHGAAMLAEEAAGRGHLCEGCHGPGSRHADDPTTKDISAPLRANARNGTGCLSCHDKRLSPVRWKMSEHKRAEVACVDCHGQKDQPHADLTRRPTSDLCLSCHGDQRGLFALTSHHPVREGRIDCADCHDPHRPMGREMNRDLCLPCHADRRGPFVFEHGAISGDLTDGCLDCHRPHGSPNARLLKLPGRGLCLQCHGNKVNHMVGTACWDCHAGIHGSNSSPLLFTR